MRFLTITISFFYLSFSLLKAQQYDTALVTSYRNFLKYEDFNKGFINDPLQLISGKVGGVSITKRGSDPNIPSNIYIRGNFKSYTQGILYIIDGIWDMSPNDIIPDEIESFEIYKDATSCAAFGSRGMAGVIVIKTKSIEDKKPFSFSFNSYLSLNTSAKKMDLLTAEEYRNLIKEQNIDNFEDGGASTDWQDQIFRSTLSKTYNLAFSGTIKSFGYRINFNHRDNPGIVIGTKKNNTNLGLKINQKAFKNKLNINLSTGIRFNKSLTIPDYYGNSEKNIFYQTYRRNPTDSVYEVDDQTYFQNQMRAFMYFNPLAIINNIENTTQSKVYYLNFNINYKIINSLYFNFNSGMYSKNNIRKYVEKLEAFNNNFEYYEQNSRIDDQKINLTPSLYFVKTINNNHNIFLKLDYSYRLLINQNINNFKNKTHETFDTLNILQTFSSIIPNINYEFKNRYLVKILLNYEYSYFNSLLLKKNNFLSIVKQNSYPSITIGWKMHNEKFLNKLKFINEFTLNVGYGYTGNSNFEYLHPNLKNLNELEKEKLAEFTIDLNYSFFNNRISGLFAYYSREAKNVIGLKPQPVPPNTYGFTYANEYHYKSKGFEFYLNIIPIQNELFQWTSSLSFYKNKDELVSAPINENGNSEGQINYFESINEKYTQLFKTGSPYIVFYLPKYAGVNNNGYTLYYQNNGDNVTTDYSKATKFQMGQLAPKFEISWFNNFLLFKHLDFEFSLRYVKGHSILNVSRMILSNSYFVPDQNIIHEGITNVENRKRFNEICDLYLEDASYLRIEYITLGYTITPQLGKYIRKIKIYTSTSSFHTFTNYSGLDPAYDYNGIDYFNVYPLARSFVFGVNFEF